MSSPPSFINQYLPPLSDRLRGNNETFYDPITLGYKELIRGRSITLWPINILNNAVVNN